MTDKIYKLKDELCKELESMQGKGLTPTTVDYIHKLIVSIEKIMKTEVIEMELEEGHSERRGRRSSMDDDDRYSERRGRSRDRGGSYEGGYGAETSYIRHGGDSSNRGYSRDDGKKQMIDRLRRLMEEANGEYERTTLRECIAQVEQM